MFNFSYEKNDIQDIVAAIYKHSEYRDYDLWVLGVAALAVVVSGVAAFFSYRLNKKQSEILEQQNNITLFKDRYEIYLYFLVLNIYAQNFIDDDTLNIKDKKTYGYFYFNILSCYEHVLSDRLDLFNSNNIEYETYEGELRSSMRNFTEELDTIHKALLPKIQLFFDYEIYIEFFQVYIKLNNILIAARRFPSDDEFIPILQNFHSTLSDFSKTTFPKVHNTMRLDGVAKYSILTHLHDLIKS